MSQRAQFLRDHRSPALAMPAHVGVGRAAPRTDASRRTPAAGALGIVAKVAVTAGVVLVLAAQGAHAGGPQPEPPRMAQSTKIKASGRMALCHMNARARGFLGLIDPQQEEELVGKCNAKLGTAFLKAEAKCQAKGALDCVTNDAATVAPRIQMLGDRLEAFLASEAVPAQRYVDNGDGTITDNQTGLQWEKKTDDASVHDKDNTYTWSATSGGTTPNGTVFTAFLNQLNNCTTSDGSTVTGGFAGHCDWRLPSILELQGILDVTAGSPTIDPIFGPTVADAYWSATSNAAIPTSAWWVSFGNGWVFNFYKDSTYNVRAVRGGW